MRFHDNHFHFYLPIRKDSRVATRGQMICLSTCTSMCARTFTCIYILCIYICVYNYVCGARKTIKQVTRLLQNTLLISLCVRAYV